MISGERNLLTVQDFGNDWAPAQACSTCSSRRRSRCACRRSSRAEGVRIYIGGESMVVPTRNFSVVSPLRRRRPRGGHARRDRPDAHGLRPHDPDRRHHPRLVKRAEPEVAARCCL